jgi:hypothetical protein
MPTPIPSVQPIRALTDLMPDPCHTNRGTPRGRHPLAHALRELLTLAGSTIAGRSGAHGRMSVRQTVGRA